MSSGGILTVTAPESPAGKQWVKPWFRQMSYQRLSPVVRSTPVTIDEALLSSEVIYTMSSVRITISEALLSSRGTMTRLASVVATDPAARTILKDKGSTGSPN